jgi:hypothetical protein
MAVSYTAEGGAVEFSGEPLAQFDTCRIVGEQRRKLIVAT